MKNKETLSIISSIATIILAISTVTICFFLNFNEFNTGDSATIKNVIVTFSYITVWILVLMIGIKIRNRGIVKCCLVFWIITLLTTVSKEYLNSTGVTNNLIHSFWILLTCQWYGIGFFVRIIPQSIVIANISFSMFIITIISLKHTKSA